MTHSRTDAPPVVRRAAIDARKLALARSFRRHPTPAEATAWELLRGRRMLGLKFRRQQIVAGFIVDFYCASLRLVVELDGGTHDDPAHAERDALRTQALAMRAITVVRLPNDKVCEPFLRELLAPHAMPSQGREHGSGP
jgi:very-short-patch-repair endonuclease